MPRSRRPLAYAACGLLAAALAGCSAGPAGPAGTTGVPRSDTSGTSGDGSAGPGAVPTDAVALETAAATVLAARARALNHHDRAAFAATLADPASPFGVRELHAFDTFVRLPVDDLAYGTVRLASALSPERRAELGPGAFAVTVASRSTLRGLDAGPRETDSTLTLVRRAGRWLVADDADGPGTRSPWQVPGAVVARGPRTLVVLGAPPGGRADPREAAALRDRAEHALDVVAGVWTARWRQRLVVLQPGSDEDLDSLLSDPLGATGEVAAVTDGPTTTTAPAVADRVVLRPGAMAALRPEGRAVVLTHEALHVAVRATLPGRTPLWMSEGLAEVAGYLAVPPLPAREVVRPLAEQVRERGLPAALPDDRDFGAGAASIAPAYNGSWVAMTLLRDRLGPARLTALVRLATSTGSAAAVAAAAARALTAYGIGLPELTRAWRARVATLTR